MLIFLYDVIIEDVSVMSSTLKSLMKIEVLLSNSGYALEIDFERAA